MDSSPALEKKYLIVLRNSGSLPASFMDNALSLPSLPLFPIILGNALQDTQWMPTLDHLSFQRGNPDGYCVTNGEVGYTTQIPHAESCSKIPEQNGLL